MSNRDPRSASLCEIAEIRIKSVTLNPVLLILTAKTVQDHLYFTQNHFTVIANTIVSGLNKNYILKF